MTIEALRTPEERFANLPDFAYPPQYVDDLPGYAGLRAAYIDTGPRNAQHVCLCLHGEPSWSFLYRRMIPLFVARGCRVIAPDFYGFGRSDKPVNDADYSFHFHRNFVLRLVERLNLERITLVAQDWGGLIGLTLPVDAGFRPRLARAIVMNTGLAVGTPPTPGFVAWRAYCASHPDLAVGPLIKRGTPHLTDAEVAAYDAPFPDVRYKAGVRAFPQLVMTDPAMPGVPESRAAMKFWSEQWNGKAFMAIGAADPVLGVEVMRKLHALIRGCGEPLVIPDGGHFLQEWGGEVAAKAMDYFERS
jgi:pimeloyl-ACP methyl ester carboxylesterase